MEAPSRLQYQDRPALSTRLRSRTHLCVFLTHLVRRGRHRRIRGGERVQRVDGVLEALEARWALAPESLLASEAAEELGQPGAQLKAATPHPGRLGRPSAMRRRTAWKAGTGRRATARPQPPDSVLAWQPVAETHRAAQKEMVASRRPHRRHSQPAGVRHAWLPADARAGRHQFVDTPRHEGPPFPPPHTQRIPQERAKGLTV